MWQTSNADEDDKVSVKIISMGTQLIRVSLHLDVTEEMTDKVCRKLAFVFRTFRN